MTEEIQNLEKIARAATPGPWRWHGNGSSKSLYLSTTHSGRRYVMGFARWGMHDGQPIFQCKKEGMVNASELLQFEVGDQSVVGMTQAKSDDSVYRADVRGIANPDAEFMAAANPAAVLDLIDKLKGSEQNQQFLLIEITHLKTLLKACEAALEEAHAQL